MLNIDHFVAKYLKTTHYCNCPKTLQILRQQKMMNAHHFFYSSLFSDFFSQNISLFFFNFNLPPPNLSFAKIHFLGFFHLLLSLFLSSAIFSLFFFLIFFCLSFSHSGFLHFSSPFIISHFPFPFLFCRHSLLPFFFYFFLFFSFC